LLVRFDIVRRGEDGAWHRIWRREIIARSQEFMSVGRASDGGAEAQTWIHPVADGRLFVDAKLDVNGPVAFEGDATMVSEPGRARQVMSLRNGDGEFRLYQSVDWLPVAAKGSNS
jgi:hypothetical protein